MTTNETDPLMVKARIDAAADAWVAFVAARATLNESQSDA